MNSTQSAFEQRKTHVLSQLSSGEIDKSPKGFIDEHIAQLCHYMNKLPNIYTCSSCSGRTTLFLNGDESKGGHWLLSTHDQTNFEEVGNALLQLIPYDLAVEHGFGCLFPHNTIPRLESTKYQIQPSQSQVFFRFEGAILCAETSDLETASRFNVIAHQAGYREAGITSVTTRYVVNTRGALRFDVPIILNGTLLVNGEYIKHLVTLANNYLTQTHQKIQLFWELLQQNPHFNLEQQNNFLSQPKQQKEQQEKEQLLTQQIATSNIYAFSQRGHIKLLKDFLRDLNWTDRIVEVEVLALDTIPTLCNEDAISHSRSLSSDTIATALVISSEQQQQNPQHCGVFTMNHIAKQQLLSSQFDIVNCPIQTFDFAQFVTQFSTPSSSLTLQAMFQDRHKQQLLADAKVKKLNIKDILVPTLSLDELTKLYNFSFLVASTSKQIDRKQLAQQSAKGSKQPKQEPAQLSESRRLPHQLSQSYPFLSTLHGRWVESNIGPVFQPGFLPDANSNSTPPQSQNINSERCLQDLLVQLWAQESAANPSLFNQSQHSIQTSVYYPPLYIIQNSSPTTSSTILSTSTNKTASIPIHPIHKKLITALTSSISSTFSTQHITAIVLQIPTKYELVGGILILPTTPFLQQIFHEINPSHSNSSFYCQLFELYSSQLGASLVAIQSSIDTDLIRSPQFQILFSTSALQLSTASPQTHAIPRLTTATPGIQLISYPILSRFFDPNHPPTLTQDSSKPDCYALNVENDVKYIVNLSKSMYCSGNGTEKLRVKAFASSTYPLPQTPSLTGEIVLDLYAGVGYFTLPYLLATIPNSSSQLSTQHLYACELNPYSVTALRHGLLYNSTTSSANPATKTNLTSRCTILSGDNRRAIVGYMLRNHITRVNMGLIPTCLDGLTNALISTRHNASFSHHINGQPLHNSMLQIHWNIHLAKSTSSIKDNNMLYDHQTSANILQYLNQRVQSLNSIAGLSILELVSRFASTPDALELLSLQKDCNIDIQPLIHEYSTQFVPQIDLSALSPPQIEMEFTKYLFNKYSIESPSPFIHNDPTEWYSQPLWPQAKSTMNFQIVNIAVVKSYGPRVFHVVYDIVCSTQPITTPSPFISNYQPTQSPSAAYTAKELPLIEQELTQQAQSYLSSIDLPLRSWFTPRTALIPPTTPQSAFSTGFEMNTFVKDFIQKVYSPTTPSTIFSPLPLPSSSQLPPHYSFPPSLEQMWRSSMLTTGQNFKQYFSDEQIESIACFPAHDVPIFSHSPISSIHPPLTHDDFISTVLPLQTPIIIRDYYNVDDFNPIWNNSEKIKELTPNNPPISIHKSTTPYMNMLPRNFGFENSTLHDLINLIHSESSNTPDQRTYFYLRSMGADKRKDVASIKKSFPLLSDCVQLPSYIPQDTYFSSILRVSSQHLQLWSHYDVADNFLIQCSGYKKVTLFHPMYAQFLGVATSVDSSSTPYTRLDLKTIMETDQTLFEQYYTKHPGLLLAFPYRHTVLLQPGDILFIPAFWLHHVVAIPPLNLNQPLQPLQSQTQQLNENIMAISINIFWRHLCKNFYQSKDVYGNKDVIDGKLALEASSALSQFLQPTNVLSLSSKSTQSQHPAEPHFVPLPYRNFYSSRILHNLISQFTAMNSDSQ